MPNPKTWYSSDDTPSDPSTGPSRYTGPLALGPESARAASGVAVGSWVPFANYLNTQAAPRSPQFAGHLGEPPPGDTLGQGEAPDQRLDPIKPLPRGGSLTTQTPVELKAQAPNQGLVAGPGLGGYYGQLSQQYLTGKRQ